LVGFQSHQVEVSAVAAGLWRVRGLLAEPGRPLRAPPTMGGDGHAWRVDDEHEIEYSVRSWAGDAKGTQW
jgi:hypothetical protein